MTHLPNPLPYAYNNDILFVESLIYSYDMLKIRLARTGKRNQAMFRMVVTEHTKAAHRGFLEVLGSVNPHTSPSQVHVQEDRVKHWLSVGARVTNRAAFHLKEVGIEVPAGRVDGKSRSGKLPEPKEEAAEEPSTPTPAKEEASDNQADSTEAAASPAENASNEDKKDSDTSSESSTDENSTETK